MQAEHLSTVIQTVIAEPRFSGYCVYFANRRTDVSSYKNLVGFYKVVDAQ